MTNNRPLRSEERLDIVEALRRGTLSHRAIAQQFKRSQSTVSALARDAGITPTHRRRRTPAAKDIEGSFGGRERINLADSVLGVIGQEIKAGGHSPRELKDITQALKLALEARRAEDFPEQGESTSRSESRVSSGFNLAEEFRRLDAEIEAAGAETEEERPSEEEMGSSVEPSQDDGEHKGEGLA